MAPKIETMLTYLRAQPQGLGLITTPQGISRALSGKGGTRFYPLTLHTFLSKKP